MKLFIYSDIHISRTSSILPLSSNSKYTYRQQMIIDTAKYMVDIINKEQPNFIINLGDTFDQHTLTSYDIETARQFFNEFSKTNKPHFVLIGNHEMINNDFNAVSMLDIVKDITIIQEPVSIPFNDCKLAFLPYCSHEEITEFPEGDYLFSHQDIQGSLIRGNFALPDGIEQQILKEKYKLVFNGHIHKSSIVNNVVNVGSATTHGFSDDNDNIPQCYIFDTQTLDLKTYKINTCPLFRRFIVENNILELQNFINSLDKNYKYILHCICPFEIKDEVKDYLKNNELIVNSRLNININKQHNKEDEHIDNINLQPNVDMKQTFTEFIDTIDLKFPKELYIKTIKEL